MHGKAVPLQPLIPAAATRDQHPRQAACDLYGHLMPRSERDAAAVLDALLRELGSQQARQTADAALAPRWPELFPSGSSTYLGSR